MAGSVLGALQGLLLAIGLAGLVLGVASYALFPWHRVNRASRIPATRRTVERTRLCLSAAFVLLAPVALGGLLSFTATMTRLSDRASAPTRSWVERLALSVPWDAVVATCFALATLLVLVPVLLVGRDVALAALGRRDPTADA